MKKSLNKLGFVSIAFFTSLFCAGTFHEYISCIVSVFLAGWLIINHTRSKKTVIYKNSALLWVTVTVVLYGLSSFWAVDPGMAFIGFIKYLPLLLFALVLMQSDECDVVLELFPYAVGAMVVLSAILAQIPSISTYFLVGDRLSGFLQEPNTFAILLLVAELLLLTKPRIKNVDIAFIAILVLGLVYSTSRIVLLITLISNIIAVLYTKSKRFIFCSVLALLAGGFISVVFLIATDNFQIIERLFTVSWKESSFVSRFLYYKDALPTIIDNPFGTGYMGYSYMQSSFQSGIYSVSFVHNDFLQLMLDIGWIPAVLFAFTVFKKIFAKKTTRAVRIILSCLVAHCFFDFDIQFLSVCFLFLILLDVKSGKPVEFKDRLWLTRGVTAVIAVASIYVGTSLILYKSGHYEASYKMYPYNTDTETALLLNSDDIEESYRIADKMQKRNEYAHISYSVKAQYAFGNGDYDMLIEQMNRSIEIAPLVYPQYEDYARMLIQGISDFKQKNDIANVEKCTSELKKIPERLAALSERISYLGSLLDEQPKTALPEALIQYIPQ
ncbi:MAG: O-antigen ligase family protein [Clostridia bacterium]|nr:O-antigen ligase family protein [Clostridia bacterium]